MIQIREYSDRNGNSPYREWFEKLDHVTAAKVVTSIYRMSLGNLSNSKSLGSGLFEYKIDFGPGYRIYFGREGAQIIVLLAGGSKKSQPADIRCARTYWQDFKSRKKR